MPSWKYYSLTIALYIVCVAGAIAFDDVGTIFEFVGAFGLSLNSFLMPGLMYLIMIRNPSALLEIETDKQRSWNKIGSYAMITVSVVNMILVVVKTILNPGEDYAEE